MANETRAQALQINQRFLNGTLSRQQFEEYNLLLETGRMTRQTAQAIIEGKFVYETSDPRSLQWYKKIDPDRRLTQLWNVWYRLGRKVFGGELQGLRQRNGQPRGDSQRAG